jgi:CDGSH-type Zn-finger protein
MSVECWCGKTLNKDNYCDGSHSLTPEQYATMQARIAKRKRGRVTNECYCGKTKHPSNRCDGSHEFLTESERNYMKERIEKVRLGGALD